MIKWTSITSFKDVYKSMNKFLQSSYYKENAENTNIFKSYASKIKLHGTNAAVRYDFTSPDDCSEFSFEMTPQSRSRDLTLTSDNLGFAMFVEQNKEIFEGFGRSIWKQAAPENDCPVTIFGEFCGKGICKGSAVNQIEKKIFAIFAIQMGNSDNEDSTLIISPQTIDLVLGEEVGGQGINDVSDRIFILPIHRIYQIDWFSEDSVAEFIDQVNVDVNDVEAEDPWVKENFGISGIGEGLVFYPLIHGLYEFKEKVYIMEQPRDLCTGYMFKAKGEKHKVAASKKKDPVSIDPELIRNRQEFAMRYVTKNRLEQALIEVCQDQEPTKRDIGPVIKWMLADVAKESAGDLVENNLTWKQVCGEVAKKTKEWIIQKV